MEQQHHHLPDIRQSWWQLAMIQLSSWMSLPTLATSILILQQNSFLGAALTIIVGNAILWFIRFGIISMSHAKRQSTLDISRTYLGDFGSYFIAILLLVSTLAWFVTQTTIAGSTLTHLVSFNENLKIDRFTQMSVFLGITSSFLCMEGIILLRKLSILSFPLLVMTFSIIFFSLPSHIPQTVNSHPISLAGLTLVLATNLGISSDFPTFFRHSRSWSDSIKALTVIQLVSIALGIFGLYFGALILNGLEINERLILSSGNLFLQISLIIFIFFSVICANVANVYAASVGWEVIAPAALIGRKEYLILGLGLTIIFILVSNLISTDALLTISDTSLVNLCIILVLGYLISRKTRKAPSRYLQFTYFIAWVLSSMFNVVAFLDLIPVSPLILGFFTILIVISLSFLGMKLTPKFKS